MSTNRRRTAKPQSRPLRRRVLGLVVATGIAVTGFAAAVPVAAQATPHAPSADTSTWG